MSSGVNDPSSSLLPLNTQSCAVTQSSPSPTPTSVHVQDTVTVLLWSPPYTYDSESRGGRAEEGCTRTPLPSVARLSVPTLPIPCPLGFEVTSGFFPLNTPVGLACPRRESKFPSTTKTFLDECIKKEYEEKI